MAKTVKPVTFVYFDVGNVLLTYTESVISLASALNAPVDEVHAFWEPLDDALNRGALTAADFWQQIKAHFGYQGPDIDVLDLWNTHFSPIKESHAFARKLSRTHNVGLLTNAMPPAPSPKQKLSGIFLACALRQSSNPAHWASPNPIRTYMPSHKSVQEWRPEKSYLSTIKRKILSKRASQDFTPIILIRMMQRNV